ncbi:hypothetical protein [Capnocytophaga stomatis]|uniref:DUF304 domain-containing protein n=1 Tax=Capnocytophaga stomatis TaxID=1848904 RepID=A0A250FV24_9FLAO|nr:hypothetical protein [Capnocytophaga stomatis]ATA88970.1 hypothetical protein CGC58_04090 [Capnocytophaga stomatis]GIJ94359.1 hypothetical protein CAPN002_15770 [Capnocytophaga stomatis]GIJ95780.1 hypothetical protein CAPN001_03490 [Capnocytophaga stomatis]GIM48840.1 hypothetical protein CAPN003_02920 [Capnocytophaga stomatis]
MKSDSLYFEKQRFTPIWVGVPLLILWSYFAVRAYQQIFLGKPFGDSPMSDVGLILFNLVLLVIISVLFVLKLKLTITTEAIQVQFYPIYTRRILFKNVRKVEIIDYKMVSSGIRVSLKYGTVYRVRGNKGLFITLKNGETLLIGIQNEEALSQNEILKSYLVAN